MVLKKKLYGAKILPPIFIGHGLLLVNKVSHIFVFIPHKAQQTVKKCVTLFKCAAFGVQGHDFFVH